MNYSEDKYQGDSKPGYLLHTLEQLLAIESVQVKPSLDQAAQLLVNVLDAEKIDVLLYDPNTTSLVAMGISDTPMGRRQQKLGLDRLPLANGGSTVKVFLTGTPYLTKHADQEQGELKGLIQPPPDGLGVMSEMGVPLIVNGERRGVLLATSNKPEFFTKQDLSFLEAVSHWIGMVFHRAELVEQQTREAHEHGRRQAAEQLLTIMAHDLKNYLTPLKGRLGIMARRARREQREQDIRDTASAQKAFEQVNHIITNLLDIARLDQGLFTLVHQPIELVDFVQEIVTAMRVSETPIRVQASTSIEISADPDRLQQALENLLANAVKYAPKHTPVGVRIERRHHDDTQLACVTVSNQGPSIPEHLQTHLFEPFVAGSSSTGLGLGLYLARGIALAHHGDLTVYSSEQEVHFTLSLPIKEE
ncbi:GAF domain-containing sensor histidine kinase [Ktedonobacter racemifer]|uniref:histidine kinase n=1 Tax=Ktedonobacter racemifer DSM 44963 TaxID=485913 RepID=D6TR54_KTERA|nr:GAF domain-containing sensor histidine kinase [Ktedonobacter racemifer]EFH87753.1 GAF sensor signal transduction histidine kinase [Ktedonobacter racemifer DSM 44963]